MNESNNQYNRFFREKFGGFSPAPPEGSWDKISSALDQESDNPEELDSATPALSQESSFWFLHWLRMKYWLYPVMTLVAAGVIALFIWQTQSTSHLHGTALIGGDTLTHGTAYLFHVDDKQLPLDSVGFHDSVPIDSSGSFHFYDVPDDQYLMRIRVDALSPYYPEYQFGYSGDVQQWDHSLVFNSAEQKSPLTINLRPL